VADGGGDGGGIGGGGGLVVVGEGAADAMELTSTHSEPFPNVPPLQTLGYVPSVPTVLHGYPASVPYPGSVYPLFMQLSGASEHSRGASQESLVNGPESGFAVAHESDPILPPYTGYVNKAGSEEMP